MAVVAFPKRGWLLGENKRKPQIFGQPRVFTAAKALIMSYSAMRDTCKSVIQPVGRGTNDF
jgi:hypothetical protein